MSTNSFSGSRAIFKINDKTVAFASGCDGTEEVLYEAVDVLDRIEVAEYVPVGYRVTFRCEVFRTVNGVKASTGTGAGPTKVPDGQLGSITKPSIGIFPRSTGTPSEILTNGFMSATITDRLTNTTLYRLDEVKATNLTFRITARGIVGQDVSFNAIRMTQEG